MRALARCAVLALPGSVAAYATFQYDAKYACGVCKDMLEGVACDRFGACDAIGADDLRDSCARVCPSVPVRAAAASPEVPDLRVARAFGTKGYDRVRISLISKDAEPPVADFFDYSKVFEHRWTNLYLHTAIKTITPGGSLVVPLGPGEGLQVPVKLPVKGAGVSGVLIADPCVNSPTGKVWVYCGLGHRFKTTERTVALVNAFAPQTDFWSITGDNFYDRTGDISREVFGRISLEAKAKVFASVPGNHDYWVMGSPWVSEGYLDQCGNGFMQYYGQDTKAAEHVIEGNASAPYDFSIDPSGSWTPKHGNASLDGVAPPWGCTLSNSANFVWYNQMGNAGLIGQSGAYTLEESLPFMREACDWVGRQDGLDVVLLFGHWDNDKLGVEPDMDMPHWYEHMRKLPGCDSFDQRGMLKFIMGHTHVNTPHPYGNVDTGFRVSGWGMDEAGAGPNYGLPIVDTTEGRVRFWYFDTSTDDTFNSVMDCVSQKGWRQCTDLAVLWLDQPVVPALRPTQVMV